MFIQEQDVFKASRVFPLEWSQSLDIARGLRYKYIDFNGFILSTENDELDYDKAFCQREDLIGDIWFTSDTHFGSERTLELSRRPFKDVVEMDKALIDNWNSVVKENDLVYHLGDFGDYDRVKELNGKVVLIFGNYERKDEITKEELLEKGFVGVDYGTLIENFNYEEKPYALCMTHHPSTYMAMANSDKFKFDFSLFGHIHKTQMVKKQGLNVGTDCHNFYPINMETVMFYKNAIENHYDNEVFMVCNTVVYDKISSNKSIWKTNLAEMTTLHHKV